MRRDAAPALALLLLGWALTRWVMPWADETVNDLFVYRAFAEPVLEGGVPYRDVFFEYPPLAAPVIALPGLAGTSEEAFRIAFAVWTLLAAAGVVLLCGALAERGGGERRLAMLAAALMPLLCGALLRTHFDLAPLVVTLAGLWLLCAGRARSGLALIGVGAMIKGFPLVVAPVALAWLVARGLRREALQAAAACAAVVAVVALAALAVSPAGATDAVSYHFERPVQVESLPALALLGLDAAGLGEARSVSSYRSDGLEHPAGDGLSVALLFTLAAVVVAITSAVARAPSERNLVLGGLAAVAAFATLGKVLSPQFVIWVLPLGALALAWRLHALAAAVAAAAILTQVEFPARYFDVVTREPFALALVAARDLALVGVLVLSLRALRPQRDEQLVDARRPALAVRLD